MKKIVKISGRMPRRSLPVVLLLFLLASSFAQQTRPWVKWSKADAEKILNDSAWAHTQTETDASELVYSPTRPGTPAAGRSEVDRGITSDQQSINNNRADRGATNQAISVNYRVRLLSAKPVRQAFMRAIALSQKNPDDNLIAGLQSFVNRDFSDYIVVAVTVDSSDQRFSGPPLQLLASAASGTLKNKTYLERQDGRRVFLMDYHAPITDGLGAKFIFPRLVDNQKLLSRDSGTVRFYCELSSQIKINVTFKTSEMVYDGKLEY
jgi:hypothetical protein